MSYNHASTMSKNKAIYLFIAQQVWSSSDIWEEQIIEDIEATGGVFSDDNVIIMDYDVNSNPPQGELEEVIARWKVMMNKAEEENEIVSSTHIVDTILFVGATIEDFYGITFRTLKETGSADYQVHSEDDVELMDILDECNAQDIAQEFLDKKPQL